MIARSRIALPIALSLLLSVLVGVQVTTTGSPAAAAPVTDFDPGLIISDAAMNDSSTMTAAGIQSFLNTKGASCSATGGNTCIKNYVESTPTRAADVLCTGAYVGGANESAATIIAKVAVVCGINPQVLLVTLQKEQGLITATAGKSAATYSRALGFGCPDNVGGWCNPSYAGFANQVYSAAKQLKRYAANPTGYSYRAGRTNTILWHPNTTCGSSQVYIQNQATASLYNYTPYRPNAAALAAGYGTGDTCSSYGNRNFHLYFTSWFGSAVQRAPIGVVDDVTTAAGTGTIRVRGWALDPDTTESINVHVYVDGALVSAVPARSARPDIGRAFGLGDDHGFDTTVHANVGVHAVCVYAIDSTKGPNAQIGCSSITVANTAPKGSVDAVAVQPGAVQIRGWALDPDTNASINVHVYVDGKLSRGLQANTSRPDVDRVYGLGNLHGFTAVIPVSDGRHTLCVYAIDSSGGTNPQIGCTTVTVQNKLPEGTLDSVSSPAPGELRVRGWTFDRDTSDPIRVHLYIDDLPARGFVANSSRPDVGRVHGVGENHGFDLIVAVPSGQHTVCVYAIDATVGRNPGLGCRTTTVMDTPATGMIEATTSTAASAGQNQRYVTSSITVTGWAWDHDASGPVDVRVLLDKKVAATVTAGNSHPAVPTADRTTIGFIATIQAAPGLHEVCIEALDPRASATSLGCASLTVADTLPIGAYDLVRSPSAGKIRVTGWAADSNTTGPIAIHASVDGGPAIGLRADGQRPDLNIGLGTAHGFDATLSPTYAAGDHNVCLFAINAPTTSLHTPLGCRLVTVS